MYASECPSRLLQPRRRESDENRQTWACQESHNQRKACHLHVVTRARWMIWCKRVWAEKVRSRDLQLHKDTRDGFTFFSLFSFPESFQTKDGKRKEGAVELLIVAVHGVDPRGHSEWIQRRRSTWGSGRHLPELPLSKREGGVHQKVTHSCPLSPTLRAQPGNLFSSHLPSKNLSVTPELFPIPLSGTNHQRKKDERPKSPTSGGLKASTTVNHSFDRNSKDKL